LQEILQQRNDKSIIFVFMPHLSGHDAVIVGVLDRLRPIYRHWTVDSLVLCIWPSYDILWVFRKYSLISVILVWKYFLNW